MSADRQSSKSDTGTNENKNSKKRFQIFTEICNSTRITPHHQGLQTYVFKATTTTQPISKQKKQNNSIQTINYSNKMENDKRQRKKLPQLASIDGINKYQNKFGFRSDNKLNKSQNENSSKI